MDKQYLLKEDVLAAIKQAATSNTGCTHSSHNAYYNIVNSMKAAEMQWNYAVSEAPKNGTLLWLLVDYEGGFGSLLDSRIAATIGHNDFEGNDIDEWAIAGWSWDHDCFSEGKGKVIAWRSIDFDFYNIEREIEQ